MIITNGKVRRTVPEQVSENMVEIQKLKDANFVRQDDVADNLSSYQTKKPLSANQGRILKDMLNQAIAGVFHYKGSIATFNDLPSSGMEIGDTYNVLDTGDNYTWDGTSWDKLSGIADLGNFYTKAESNDRFVDFTTDQTIDSSKTIAYGKEIVFNTSNNSVTWSILSDAYQNITIRRNSADLYFFSTTGFIPKSNNSRDLGTESLKWKNVHFAGVINPNTVELTDFNASLDSVSYRISHLGNLTIITFKATVNSYLAAETSLFKVSNPPSYIINFTGRNQAAGTYTSGSAQFRIETDGTVKTIASANSGNEICFTLIY